MALRFGYSELMMLQTFLLFLLIVSFASPILGLESRKLDDVTVSVAPADQKCAPCNPSPPPPSPSLPPPPPPALPPPPPPKKSSSNYCPPPPTAYTYVTGPPGDLYPIVNDFSGAGRSSGLPVLIGCGLLGFFLRIFGL